MKKFGFKTAYTKLPGDVQPVVKKEIMAALGIINRDSWRRRLNGMVIPKVTDAADIERIFKENGSQKVWDHEFKS